MFYTNVVRIAQPMTPYINTTKAQYMEGLQPGDLFCGETRENFGREITAETDAFETLYITTRKGEPALDIRKTVPQPAAHFNFAAHPTMDLVDGSQISLHCLYHIRVNTKLYSLLLPSRYPINAALQKRLGSIVTIYSKYHRNKRAGEHYLWQLKDAPNDPLHDTIRPRRYESQMARHS